MIRPRPIHIVVVLVVVLVLGCMSLAIFRTGEPRYQGRTLTEWIKDVKQPPRSMMTPRDKTKSVESDAAWQASSNAVKQIGVKAIPFLLRWVKGSDSPLRERLSNWLDGHPALQFRVKSANECYRSALFGFVVLGNEAKPAWPVLIQWTCSTDTDLRYVAFTCLSKSRPDKETLLPVLLRLIHDPDPSIQQAASRVCHNCFPKEAEAAGVYKMFPELKGQPTRHLSAYMFEFD
jgi:hypothetical protein